ncbi:MAG TPA: PfkB family carbohydrate kinase [Terriglobia bacterium]|nr:PfkB family carbohydrate kinase [Terriglobia bacterium]
MSPRTLQINRLSPYRRLVGVGGIGTGLFFELEGQHTLGRNESRPGRLLNIRDYGKLHIIIHYIAVLLGAKPDGSTFHIVPVGKVGEDDAGSRMIKEMAAAGMDVHYVESLPERPTQLSVCFQYPDGAGGNITTSDSAASALTSNDIDRCAGLLAAESFRCIALAAPEVPLETRDRFLRLATDHHAFRAASFTSGEIVTAKEQGMLSRLDLLAMNQDEAGTLVKEPFDPTSPDLFLQRCADLLCACQPHIQLILSAGKHGAFAYAEGGWDYRPALDVPVRSTAGAGDALLAGVLTGLVAGMPFIKVDSSPKSAFGRLVESAFEFGVLLAAYTVTSPHTIHPDANLDTLLAFGHAHNMTLSGLVRI